MSSSAKKASEPIVAVNKSPDMQQTEKAAVAGDEFLFHFPIFPAGAVSVALVVAETDACSDRLDVCYGVGVAMCSPLDEFSEATAETCAAGRARKAACCGKWAGDTLDMSQTTGWVPGGCNPLRVAAMAGAEELRRMWLRHTHNKCASSSFGWTEVGCMVAIAQLNAVAKVA